MTHSPPRDEVRPADPVADPFSGPAVPLLRLRRPGREAIPPEACLLGPRCLVCRWRREGLLDVEPERRAA
ncbi:hypothetical protein [Rubrivirga marina]|uniref:Uncharacterized protein n=1 Tax=Rubrivirga marina TaxID=1196024 RepID=A0A271J1M2_9BACT|nr:hypothetical protein [Rubrivirga marina]PAP77250.1 hypothetical protein BSZ37_12805 [Rubrivirga marina]